MDRRQIVVRIATDGTVAAHTEGFKGPACLDSIGLLEELLDSRVVASDFTREYAEVPQAATVDDGMDDVLRQQ